MTMTDTTCTDPVLNEWVRCRAVAAEAFALIFDRQRECLPLREFLPSPIDIPKCRSGGISITHREVAGETPIVGRRQALVRGVVGACLVLDAGPLRVHELRDKRAGVWMTDLPEELHQIAVMLKTVRPHGSVLVGGLGLGLVARRVAALRGVKEVVVVERSADVIKLIEPHLPARKVSVVRDDIGKFLRDCVRPFDNYLLDTWQGTSESTWWSEVAPLKRIIRHRWGRHEPKIDCWAEDIMAGQVLPTLTGAERHWHHERLPPSMSAEETAHFFRDVGSPEWETAFGNLVKTGGRS